MALPAIHRGSFMERSPSAHGSYADEVQERCGSVQERMMYDDGGSSGMMVPYNNYYQRVGVGGAGGSYGGRYRSTAPADAMRYSYPDGQEYVNKVYRFSGNPTFRSGRLGGPWRHVIQCTGNLGNHICFVDGQVKTSDMMRFPPYGYPEPAKSYNSLPVREARMYDTHTQQQQQQQQQQHRPLQHRYTTKYNKHAKHGFKYWYEEKPMVSEGPVQTISGRMMKLGVGF